MVTSLGGSLWQQGVEFTVTILQFFFCHSLEHRLSSAAGGRGSLINNLHRPACACVSYSIRQHVCNVVCPSMCACLALLPTAEGLTTPFQTASETRWRYSSTWALPLCLMPTTYGTRKPQRSFLELLHTWGLFTRHIAEISEALLQYCSLADFKRFRIWGRSSTFIVFLVSFFTLSVYQLPNCMLFCLQSRRY